MCSSDLATLILCDNKSSIAMTKNLVYHSRTRHIAIKHHFIRDTVEKEKVVIKYCNTNDQVADIFTKALPRDKFHYFRELMNVTTMN